MRLYKVSSVIILFILIAFDGFANCLHAKINVCKNDKFEGEVIYDKAAAGFYIFKIIGSAPNKEIQLTKSDAAYEGHNKEPKWSPGGRYIAYLDKKQIENNSIYIMDADGRNKRKIINLKHGIMFDIKWDKNGKEILFTYNPQKSNEKIVNKAVDIKTGNSRNIDTSREKVKGCNETTPSANEDVVICEKWLMPGKDNFTIYRKEDKPETVSEKIKAEIRKFFNKYKKDQEIIFYKGSSYKKRKELVLEDAHSPLWSKDNAKFAIMTGADLTIFDKNGNQINQIKEICESEGSACPRIWSNDSRKLLYSCYCGAEEIQEKIYLLNLETKKSFFITEGQHPDWYFK